MMTSVAKSSATRPAILAIAIFLSMLVCGRAGAQGPPSDTTSDNGTHWYGSYDGVHENISLSSGNLSFCIPLLSIKEPNNHNLSIPLCYNSQFQEQFNLNNGSIVTADALSVLPWSLAPNTPAGDTTPPMGVGWSLIGYPAYYYSPSTSPSGTPVEYMPDGGRYGFPMSGGTGPDGGNADTYFLNYPVQGAQKEFIMKDGTQYLVSTSAGSPVCPASGCAKEILPDGAIINWTSNSVTDAIGRTVTESSGSTFNGSSTVASTAYIQFQYPVSSGNATVVVEMTTMTFNCASNSPDTNNTYDEVGSGGYLNGNYQYTQAWGPYSMPTAVILPNGLNYTFQYDNCGMLRKVTYPSGGYTRYDYSAQTRNYINCGGTGNACGSQYYVNEVSAKHVCPASSGSVNGSLNQTGFANTCGVAEQTTQYSPVITPGVPSGGANSQMTVTDPVGNYVVYQFSSPSAVFTAIPALETSRKYYNSSGALLKTVTTQYSTSTSPGSTFANTGGSVPQNELGYIPALPTIETTTLDNGMVSQIQWSYNFWDALSDDSVLTEERAYDFAQGSPGPLLKRTDYTWLHRDNPTTYGWGSAIGWPVTAHICDRRTSEVVYDGAGKILEQTKYVYDYGSPSTYGARGILTSVSKWRNTDGAWLTTSYQYGTFGNVIQKTDPKGNITQYGYSDNYSDGVNRSSSAFLTSTTDSLGHVTKNQYYFGSGLLAASCGENFSGSCVTGLNSGADYASYSYDVMGRNTATMFGDGGSTQNTFFESQYPLEVQSVNQIGVSTWTVLDGMARTTQTQLIGDPSCPGGTVNVDTAYDSDGRKWTVTNPYCSSNQGAPTSGITTYAYDGLSRVTQITHPDSTYSTNSYTGRAVLSADEGNGSHTVQRISQSDALGRLIYVCEVTGQNQQGSSNNTPSSCSLDVSGSGFLTIYGYDGSSSNGPVDSLTSVTQGGVNRSFVYDSLGELRSASNPESGLTTYGYDNDGNLLSKTDAKNIVTSYSYDALNRLTAKSYSDGTTASACFQYDQNVSGRGIGRLTTEWTQMGACPSSPPGSGALTQRTFGAYDPMGRVTTDEQCSLLGNCTNSSPYTLNYSYDQAGDITGATNGLSGSGALSFTSQYNSVGRLYKLQGSVSGGNSQTTPLFMATGYSPAGALSAAQIGVGANDSGIALHRDYNNRLLPIDEVDTVGQTPGSATVQITGYEQAGSSYGPGYTYGSVTFSGSEQCPSSGCDYGTFLIFIGSQQGQQYSSPHQFNYGQFDTPESLAIALAEEVNCSNSPVVAYAVGPTVYFVSCSASNTAYSLSAGLAGYRYEGQYSPSFSVSASGSSLTAVTSSFAIPGVGGNTNSTANAASFYGTEQSGQTGAFVFFVFANSVNSGPPIQTVTVNWGASSTPSTLASALAAAFAPCSGSNTTVTAALDTNETSGPTVLLSSCNSTTTYSISGEVAGYNNEGSGASPSFIELTSGSWPSVQAASEGPTPIYDSGTVSLLVNGTQIATTTYGSGSTASSIASALVSNGANNGLVTLSANGARITVTGIGDGSITDYSYQVNSSSSNPSVFSSASFAGSPTSGSLTGATNAPLYNWAINSYAPNGDVLSMSDSVMGTWSYSYDDFNRLTSGSATAGVDNGLTLGWTYDRYGNRWAQNATGTGNASAVQPQLSFSGNNNRVDGWTYDADGNLLNDGRNNYAYDAEGRIVSLNGQPAYLYDAEGRRVAKYSGGTTVASYILGLSGDQVTELNGTGAWVHSNLWIGGKMFATYEGPAGPSPNTYHLRLTDWVGTNRLQANSSGNLEEACFSYPFGDGLLCTGTDASEHHFTGKERDAESGLDYFGSRYMNSNLGRWMSPDQLNLTDDRVHNPSNTVNKYAYGANNPLEYVDQDGRDITLYYENPSLFPPGAGHFMMVAENQQTGDAAVMSFGPVREGFQDAVETLAGAPMMSTNTFDSNMSLGELRQNFSSLTIQTSPEEAQQVIDFIRNHPEGFQNPYTLYNENCTTVCLEALKIIGKITGKDWTPTQLWKNAFANYANSWWKNNGGLWFSQPGVNYGSPSGNYDEYGLLFLLLQGSGDDGSSVTTTQTVTTTDGQPLPPPETPPSPDE